MLSTRGIVLSLLMISSSLLAGGQSPAHRFELSDSAFELDGKPFQIISGEIHYPRVPREAWRQRMRMARAMGLNTIGTYVFWNLHEPEIGKFDFSGNNDIAEFVRIAGEEGLYVILRPSPYICAEWEFGGYPYWLQNVPGLKVRSKEKNYLEQYRKYILEVGKQLAPLQINHGGNILMVQVENEYGAYGADKEYLEINQKLFREAGFDGLLYTCDPEPFLSRGCVPDLLPAVNGLDNPAKIKSLVRSVHGGKGPFFVAEWYPAWFDWWGTGHHIVPASKYAPGLDSVLSAGISINMYMFHGGSTRQFMNGANFNDRDPYEPQISSYDYDAPLDEAGNPTGKFMAFREVIGRHLPAGEKLPDIPQPKEPITIPSIRFTGETGLFGLLPAGRSNPTPLSFEDLDQAYGFVLYRTQVEGGQAGILKIQGLRDYGIVFVNGIRAGILDRRLRQDSLLLTLPQGKVRLDVLVENLGRINYGPYLLQNKKGITGRVTFGGNELKGWEMFRLPFDDVHKVPAGGVASAGDGNVPVLKRGTFELEATGDTYLDLHEWGKGVVWVNGHNLGRYWNVGPQQTIYVPDEWLKKGSNDIMIFELLKPDRSALQGIRTPILNEMYGGYKLVWSDEFDTEGRPDSAKWGYERGFVRNEELQWYQPENAFCHHGHLVIEAKKEDRINPLFERGSRDWRRSRDSAHYTSACLLTRGKGEWLYGRFEMRAKIDIRSGMWPAWWTLGIAKRWPGNGEIDIMEYYRRKLLANIACLGANGRPEWHSHTFPVDSLGEDWSAQFHVWRMDWTARDISLYVDDHLLNRVVVDSLENKDGSGFNPFRQPHYMLINLAIGGQNGGDPGKTSFPGRYEIDYIRVYQKTE